MGLTSGRALSFGNWTLGSTMVGIGLNWWQAILTIFLSQLISSIAMFFNSRCASVYHIGYPIVGRAVFGMYVYEAANSTLLINMLTSIGMACVLYALMDRSRQH